MNTNIISIILVKSLYNVSLVSLCRLIVVLEKPKNGYSKPISMITQMNSKLIKIRLNNILIRKYIKPIK
jgi:hypothetical protein